MVCTNTPRMPLSQELASCELGGGWLQSRQCFPPGPQSPWDTQNALVYVTTEVQIDNGVERQILEEVFL